MSRPLTRGVLRCCCEPNRDPTSYNPYALDVVPFSAVDPDDFYTMSVRGVTHYVNGLTQDFTTLDQWEREYQLFNAMCTLTVRVRLPGARVSHGVAPELAVSCASERVARLSKTDVTIRISLGRPHNASSAEPSAFDAVAALLHQLKHTPSAEHEARDGTCTLLQVFKKYKAWKGFRLWRKAVRQGKSMRVQRVLKKNLFLLNPIFQNSLMNIRELCYGVSEARLHSIQPRRTYTLQVSSSRLSGCPSVHHAALKPKQSAQSGGKQRTRKSEAGSGLVITGESEAGSAQRRVRGGLKTIARKPGRIRRRVLAGRRLESFLSSDLPAHNPDYVIATVISNFFSKPNLDPPAHTPCRSWWRRAWSSARRCGCSWLTSRWPPWSPCLPHAPRRWQRSRSVCMGSTPRTTATATAEGSVPRTVPRRGQVRAREGGPCLTMPDSNLRGLAEEDPSLSFSTF